MQGTIFAARRAVEWTFMSVAWPCNTIKTGDLVRLMSVARDTPYGPIPDMNVQATENAWLELPRVRRSVPRRRVAFRPSRLVAGRSEAVKSFPAERTYCRNLLFALARIWVESGFLSFDVCIEFQHFFGSLDFDFCDGDIGGGLSDFTERCITSFIQSFHSIAFLLQWFHCELRFLHIELQEAQLGMVVRPCLVPFSQGAIECLSIGLG